MNVAKSITALRIFSCKVGSSVWTYNRRILMNVVRHLALDILGISFNTYFWSISPVSMPLTKSYNMIISTDAIYSFCTMNILKEIWTKELNLKLKCFKWILFQSWMYVFVFHVYYQWNRFRLLIYFEKHINKHSYCLIYSIFLI